MAPLTFTRTGNAQIDKWLGEAAEYLPTIPVQRRIERLAGWIENYRRPPYAKGETLMQRSQAILVLERWQQDFETERATADAGLLPVGDYVMRG